MKIVIGLALSCILWWISCQARKPRLIRIVAAVVIGSTAIISPVGVGFLTWGLTLPLPSVLPEHVDAIVILGRGADLQDERITAAWRLWQGKRASRIFASGMMDASEMVKRLRKEGVPSELLSGEECSQTTEENAIFSSAILQDNQVQDVLLVTDAPHMLRAFLVFRSVGFTVHPYLVPVQKSSEMSTGQILKRVLREYAGLAFYGVKGKFRRRALSELSPPPQEVSQKIVQWSCKVPRNPKRL